MGKVLQIRVSATTWNEDLVEKTWPRLYELAFSVPTKFKKHGVAELIEGLEQGLAYLDWSKERRAQMGSGIENCAKLLRELERALADWQVREANRLTDEIEKVLEELEDKFVK